jgi:hypothetical protein
MKKFILSAVAAGALAIGGVAQADVIDSVGNAISRLFGVPYAPVAEASVPLAQYNSYRDAWGRTVYLDAYNRPIYIEQNGAVVPYSGVVAVAPSYDDDRDGVSNQYDRFPLDPRYR